MLSSSQDKLFNTIGILRIALGSIFLWSFFDKLFGLGFATCRDAATGTISPFCSDAWIQGASPTAGFLQFATSGPLQSLFQSMTGNFIVDWLFMLGLLLIGTALILGIGITVATISGIVFMLSLWLSMLLPENHPIVDEHIIYILSLITIFYANDHQQLGLGAWWNRQKIVQKYPLLR